mgnify:CR=1 FL=1
MQQSDAVREALLDVGERLSAGDVAGVVRRVSAGPATLPTGPAPGGRATDHVGPRHGTIDTGSARRRWPAP